MIRLSVVVPAFNAAGTISACLQAIHAAAGAGAEVLVVDDGSTDETPALARQAGANVLLQSRRGPAAARNAGAEAAAGAILVFVDADVIVHADAIGRILDAFRADPGLTAVFGSYDASPRVRGTVARYRNLLHAYTHQTGQPRAATFWAGLGAIRRQPFLDLGGFDARRFATASVEDIEFGMRLRAAGGTIALDRSILGTHCKEWTLPSMVTTDLWSRAVPWTRLLRDAGALPNDLNLRWSQRASAGAAWLLPAALAACPLGAWWPLAAPTLLLLHFALNARFLAWVWRNSTFATAAASVPLQLLFHWVAGLGFLIGRLPVPSGRAPVISPRGAART